MNETVDLHDLVIVTDKQGRNDKTENIAKLTYNSQKNIYNITYKDGKTYPCRSSDLEIVHNALKEKSSLSVFDYLLRMAEFSDIKNDEGQNQLVKNLSKSRFVHHDSVLSVYLNPENEIKSFNSPTPTLFPFGCNSSQFKAVKTALENQISIIQGPPGTGKTQTILNIIANLLMEDKTVLVVSNNNAATANVYEKLCSKKYGLGFICATLGKKQNIELFLENQNLEYPEYLQEWSTQETKDNQQINEDIRALKKFFQATEKISAIKSEQTAIKTEQHYFNEKCHDIYKNKRLAKLDSQDLMSLMQKIQFVYTEKETLNIFRKLNLKAEYGIGPIAFWRTEPEKILDTIKATYYSIGLKELDSKLQRNSKIVQEFNPNVVYEDCLQILKKKMAERYSKSKRTAFKDSKDIYRLPRLFTEEYPVILSTTFSSRASIGSAKDFLFDYVIMDEASQVDIVTGALALSCAKNAVIVGDKMQLPNVIEESKKRTIQSVFEKTGLEDGYNFTNSFLSSIEQVLPETPQTLLREHYRCHPKIIEFCNKQFYGGQLLIMSEDHGETDVLKAIKTVPGNFCSGRYNQRQIDVIKEEILPALNQDEINNLGIIAPYNNQTDEILKQIPGIEASTVHKFQGREKDNIIISTVDNQVTSFSDDANMLNVAISRAKKKLAIIISGNKQPVNSNLMALIKYIQYNNFSIEESTVCSIFDFLYTEHTKAKIQYLNDSNKISKFDSENATYNLLKKILSEPDYTKYGFVFEMPLKDIASKTAMVELPQDLNDFANKSWAHVDFTIFNKVTKEIVLGIEVDGYSYHKPGKKQALRDEKKNQIFKIIGLPLLRLSTKGSGEEDKIRTFLKDSISYR